MRIFFAGPLTQLAHPEDTKAFYVKLSEVATEHGSSAFWAFRSGTDPVKNPGVAPQAVYETDTHELAKSDLVVAYVGEPSTGTGIEIEFARQHGIPVYLTVRTGQTRLTHASRQPGSKRRNRLR